ncbi:MAG: MATE family efflux transporter [Anaerolineales bacterium]|nr:MATE family efflux transporter [Anaerolineales bacterium]
MSEPTQETPAEAPAPAPPALLRWLPERWRARLPAGALTRRVLTLAWPSVAEQSLVTIIGLVAAYIVGHLGAAALAGVGLGGQVLNLVAALFGAVGVGATALIARHIGAREPEAAGRLAWQALLLAGGVGALAAGAGWVLAEPIIRALGAAPDVVAAGTAWLQTVAPSFAFIGVLLVGNAALRGAGDTRSPLYVMLAVNVVNVGVAWTLTRGTFGLPRLGVVGTGLGAASGQIIGALLVIGRLLRSRGPLPLARAVPRPDFNQLGRILNIGLPAGAEQLLLQVALLNLAVIISQFGTAAYAAHSIGLRVAALSFLPGWGFSVAATTLVGQELGARRPDQARQATYVAFGLALVVMAVMGALLFIFEAPILLFFTDDPAVLAAGAVVVRASAVQQPLLAASFVFSGALRGAGDTRTTLLITVGSIWGLRLAAAYLLGISLGLGLLGAWLAVGLDFGSRAFFFWRRFESGRWMALKV